MFYSFILNKKWQCTNLELVILRSNTPHGFIWKSQSHPLLEKKLILKSSNPLFLSKWSPFTTTQHTTPPIRLHFPRFPQHHLIAKAISIRNFHEHSSKNFISQMELSWKISYFRIIGWDRMVCLILEGDMACHGWKF